jgi:hypothetical protein
MSVRVRDTGLVRDRGRGTAGLVDTAIGELPELRSTPSPVEVVLTRSASQAMREEVFWLTRSDGLECGGFCFGRVPRSWDKTLEVTHATTTGDGAIRGNGSLVMDSSRWQDAERWLARNQWHDSGLVGFFHTHPGVTGEDAGLPSDHDLRAFLAARDWANRVRGAAYSVGLILAAGRISGAWDSEYSWATPQLSAWVTRRTDAGTPITERANVKGWR